MKHLLLLVLLSWASTNAFAQEEDVDEVEKQRRDFQQSINSATDDISDEMKKNKQQKVDYYSKEDGGAEYIPIPAEGEKLNTHYLEKLVPKMRQNTLAGRPKVEVAQIVTEKSKGTYWEPIFRTSPSTKEFIIDLLSDEKAFVLFASILAKPDKLRRYFYCFLVVFIISMYWNHKLPKKVPLSKRFRRKFAFYIGALFINLSSFYMIFRQELGPTFKIFWKHFGL